MSMGFNCTIMELKFPQEEIEALGGRVLIVPLWN